jgi:hypothetical protein
MTLSGFTGSAYDGAAFVRTADRQRIVSANRPEPESLKPLTPEQQTSRAAADEGIAMRKRWADEEEADKQAKIAARQRREAILKMQQAFIDCGLDAQEALRRATEKIGGL